jgi:hypothetical protein
MRYLLLLSLVLTGCLKREPVLPETTPPLYVPETLATTKGAVYQHVTLYQHRARWLLPDSYTPLEVPVTRPGRLDPKYTAEKDLFLKAGDDEYKPVKVIVVLMEEYRRTEMRRRGIEEDMQFWFLLAAGIGALMFVCGLAARLYNQPFWDELVIYGFHLAAYGLALAWWIEWLPYIAACAVANSIVLAAYGMWKSKRNETVNLEMATTTEQMKMLARPVWERVKATVKQSDATKDVVDRLKEKAKDLAVDRVVNLVEHAQARVVVPSDSPLVESMRQASAPVDSAAKLDQYMQKNGGV